ncbi:DUF6941 family protein [Lysinibacillus fusiformis]|uniref:DUF6941 family protein n=1 Tax=Lysinibacillus fusiformis TaxID=28031 RepID=UPI00263B185C|nr:hypothetical protein [Lysinibacillus fusiformis]MDC6267993.1 hypothetical protein [Lysinibacillus sphaericus]MDN4967517.1 hypothetical protein [Lysinibacillus fusiformis]
MKIAYVIPSDDLMLGPDNELLIKNPLLVIAKSSFPEVHDFSVNIGIIKTEDNTELSCEVFIIRASDEKVIEQRHFTQTIKEHDTTGIVRQIHFNDFEFTEKGIYNVVVQADGKKLEASFNVVLKE